MARLMEILNEVSIERGFEDFKESTTEQGSDVVMEFIIRIAAHRYAIEVAKASLAKAAENVRLNVDGHTYLSPYKFWTGFEYEKEQSVHIDKSSITSPDNTVTL